MRAFIEGDVVILGSSLIGKCTLIGNNVFIGCVSRAKLLDLLKNEAKLSYEAYDAVSEGSIIGDNCVIRTNTVIYEGAKLLNGVETGHGVLIREHCVVGENTRLGTHAILDGRVEVGRAVNIQSGVYLPPGSKVGDNAFLGPYVTVTNDKYPPSPKISGVTIGDNAIVGARALLIAGVKVGENAVVAAGAVVTKDVLPNVVVMGVPAKPVGTRQEYEQKRRAYLNSH